MGSLLVCLRYNHTKKKITRSVLCNPHTNLTNFYNVIPGHHLTARKLYLILHPSIKASPLVTSSSPVSILNVVVFPAPLIPSNPKHSPAGIPSDVRSTATNARLFRPGYTLRNSLITRTSENSKLASSDSRMRCRSSATSSSSCFHARKNKTNVIWMVSS